MRSFLEYFSESANKSKVLHAYDIDDTLFAHDNRKLKIGVLDQNGKRVYSLSNSQYNSHNLPDGHSYDYSKFRSAETFDNSAKPIKVMIDHLNGNRVSNHHIAIITARADLDDKNKFKDTMKRNGIDISQIYVHRVGNMPGRGDVNKAKVIHHLIKSHGLEEVHMYDDSPENLNKFLALKQDHPNVKFNAHHINYNNKSGKVQMTTRKA